MGLRGPLPPSFSSSAGVKGGQGQGLSLVSGRAQGCARRAREGGREGGEMERARQTDRAKR